jgi:hypothetical protein
MAARMEREIRGGNPAFDTHKKERHAWGYRRGSTFRHSRPRIVALKPRTSFYKLTAQLAGTRASHRIGISTGRLCRAGAPFGSRPRSDCWWRRTGWDSDANADAGALTDWG